MLKLTSNQTVYYGPATSTYPSMGTVFTSDSIKWLWVDGSWYFIEYPVSGGHKRGYIPAAAVSGASSDNSTPAFSSLISNAGARTVESGATTYTGPNSNGYPSAGSVSTGEKVQYLGYKENGYSFIEYSVGSSGQKKRAFFNGAFKEKDETPDPDSGTSKQTRMRSAQTVYYGPSASSYKTVGSVGAGEAVTAVVADENNEWVQIEYNAGSAGLKKRGYVKTATTELASASGLPHTSRKGSLTVTASGTAYTGPSSSKYYEAGSLSRGETVTDLGYEEAGYCLVEYDVTSTSYKKCAYFNKDALSNSDSGGGSGGDTGSMKNYTTFIKGKPISSGLPMAGAQVTQGFNDKTTNRKGHLGYDLGGITYAKPLFAGTVAKIETSNSPASGRAVCVKHTVNGITFYSSYLHLQSVNVSVGQSVNTGTNLGRVGGSGGGSDSMYAPHVHVCVYTGSAQTNPYGYCAKNGAATCEEASNYRFNGYNYGPDFPRCGGVCFYDPYGVVTSNVEVIAKYPG